MRAQYNKLFNTARILLLGAPLFLAACHSDFGPFPMPSGYAHLDELYKAPPGPEPVLKKIDHQRVPQSIDNGPAETAVAMSAPAPVDVAMPLGVWDDAASDLIARMVETFGKPAEPVYIQSAATMSGAEMNLDKALRAAMMNSGIKIAPAPGMGPFTLDYAISGLDVGDGTRSMITITLKDSGTKVNETTGIYTVGTAPVMQPMPAPHQTTGPAMSSGEPMPIGPAN